MFRGRAPAPHSAPLWGIAGKAGYVVCCMVSAGVLVGSGVARSTFQEVSAIGNSHAIVSGPSVGEQNILLMGLESRTDWNGNILPNDILNALHAGSRAGVANGVGGNATNTLILIHIPAGGGKAIGISIPRDDYVTYPTPYYNETGGKIDNAYGLAMAAKENQLLVADHGKMTNQIAFQGNEAGRAAAVATVESLTGVHVDHFAEVNLDGFYELAKAFRGVEVCLNHPVALDSFSGFYAKRAGYQHLNAKMALAFVRQRHGLTNGDLDRTKRQQAVIDSVIHQLKTNGILSDFGKLRQLLSTASKFVITDANWDLLDFATQMRSLSAGKITFQTLPIQGYATIGGQDDNVINLAQVRQFVQDNFFPAAKSAKKPAHGKNAPTADPAATTVDVLNGGHLMGLAGHISAALIQAGYKAGTVGNTTPLTSTEVLYGSGVAGSAAAIAAAFGVTAQPSAKVPAGTVQVLIGADTTTTPSFGTSASATATSSAGTASPAPSSASTSSPTGGAVNAINGIPCVN